MRWAQEKGFVEPDVVGAVIQLGRCFDLMDERFVGQLTRTYEEEHAQLQALGRPMPTNKAMRLTDGIDDDLKNRQLDCHIINTCLQRQPSPYETVRGAFWEGAEAFPGAMIRRASHIQIAVRERRCILGVFRPTGLS